MANKYTLQEITVLNQYYSAGLSREIACAMVNIPEGSFTYLMRKYGFSTRPKGFQKGNKTKGQFKKGKQQIIVCLICSQEFEVPEWKFKAGRKCCSRKCHIERLRQNNSGKNHWNWQGGISNKWDTLHNSQEYKEWRMAIFKRDWFTCQKCNSPRSRKNPLHAHHIKPKSKYPELILDIDNGQTLCKQCHIETHRGRHR